jgi:glyoxylase-like metal-dependent hydrolase (beta-lactamase superfamily II)/rhodanese-related sulfurtransferase
LHRKGGLSLIIQQFFVNGLAHSSYLLGGAKTCAVIDPRRDIHVYLDTAKAMGLRITHILETHLHADFISGHMDLAEKTGAEIYAPKTGNCAFDHVALSESGKFEIEDMELKVLETPGHTPEHIVYLVIDHSRGEESAALFSGDTLFVGDVGRPDLFPDIAKELASKLFNSLQKLAKLPDFCEVYPAHGAGSLCGRAMSAKRTTTIGYEKKFNYAFHIKDAGKFIELFTTEMPEAPDHFSRCSEINRKGPVLVRNLPTLVPLDPLSFSKKAQEKNTVVLDIRSYEAFGGQHIAGSYHIDFGSNFSTFAGWVLPPEVNFLLVTETPAQAEEAVVLLRRVGLDRTIGYLEGGMYEWAKSGLRADHIPQLSAEDLYKRMTSGSKIGLVDVRAKTEFQTGHIEGAINIPAPDLRERHRVLDTRVPIVTICNTGHRSSLGASILKQKGFKEVYNLAGGMTGYNAAGYGAECLMCVAPHVPEPRISAK